MEDESEGQDRNHDVDHRGAHEVATELEPAVAFGEADRIFGHLAEVPVQGVDHGEEVDGAVQEQENHQKSAADALDELLANRGG